MIQSPEGEDMAGVSTFTEAIGDSICERIASGESVRAICSDEQMPAMSTVFKWLADNKTFSEQYARAKQAQAEYYVDEILDIADDGTNDWMEIRDKDGDKVVGWRENGEALRRSVLRVDARKWVAAKLLPKKYGDKIQQEHSGAIKSILIPERIATERSQTDVSPDFGD